MVQSFRTTNGGTVWTSQESSTTLELYDVSFTDANTGTVVGINGTILRTTNGGTTWISQTGGTIYSLFGVSFTDANNGSAVGFEGTILRTTNGGVTFVGDVKLNEVPEKYSLGYNFPNPFNPSTTIRYAVLQQSLVTIKVFDILGNEVETLLNAEKSKGTYDLTWNAFNKPSGVYFYRIEAGAFIQTRKMLLMK